MGIACDMLRATRRLAHGSLGLAAVDFDRSGYTSEWHPESSAALHTKSALALRMGLRATRPGTRRAVGGPRRPARGHARARRVRLLPGARIRVPRAARVGATAARPARLGARARRLRVDGRERARGVRVHLPGQRRPAGVLAARDGDQPVRDRLPGAGRRPVPGRPRPPLPRRSRDGDQAGRRHAPRSPVLGRSNGPTTASTSSGSTGSRSRTNRSRWCRPASTSCRSRTETHGGRKSRPWQPGGISPYQFACGQRLAEAEGRPYDSHGACVDSLPAAEVDAHKRRSGSLLAPS